MREKFDTCVPESDLFCFNMMISSSIHIPANDIISFFFKAEQYSIVYKYLISFTHPSTDEHLAYSIVWLLWIMLL
jgi:hypothetical protein